MTRKEIHELAVRRAQLEAQERHRRIWNARVEREEQAIVDRMIHESEAFLATEAARERKRAR
jgi:hypothetical protein